MKRLKDSDIIPLIIDRANLVQSVYSVIHGTDRKTSKQGREILEHIDQICDWLAAEIDAGVFRVTRYGEEDIIEGGKRRRIQFLYSYYEKIGINAIIHICEKLTFGRFIRTTAASIKNRGTHDLLNIIRRDIREDPENMAYFYKSDVSKFYESIDQDEMMAALRRYFKGPKILTMLERFVRIMPKGLSIGLRSSQYYGNVLLSQYIDQPNKSGRGEKHHYRYCDDTGGGHGDKRAAWRNRNFQHEQLGGTSLHIKENERVFPISTGIDFLGYVIYPDHTRIRKRNKVRTARRLKHIRSKTRRREIIASFYSLCKHANAKHLFHKITGLKMSDYSNLKSLAELGISSTPGKRRNGQKNFPCLKVPLKALVGSTLCIMDFQPGMSTKFSRENLQKARAEGDPAPAEKTKYLVCAKVIKPNRAQLAASNITLKTGDTIKFFAGYPDMCDIIDALNEAGKLGENKVTIVCNSQGNYTEYLFT